MSNNKIKESITKKIKKTAISFMLVFLLILLFGNLGKMGNAYATSNIGEEAIKKADFGVGVIASMGLFVLKIVITLAATIIATVIGIVLTGEFLTLDKVLFNQLPLINLDYTGNTVGKYAGVVKGVANGFTIMLVLGISLQLIILLYTLIRFMTVTTSSSKAEIKELLVEWVKGIGILFGIIIFIFTMIGLNNAIVKALYISFGANNTLLSGINGQVVEKIFKDFSVGGFLASIVYAFIVFLGIIYFIYYVRRFIKISFLILISPIITSTYLIDVAGDKKSQSLNMWVKEFMITLFIQPVHILIYSAIVLPLIAGQNNVEELFDFSTAVEKIILTLFALAFMHKGEQLVRKIFNVKAEDSKASIATALVILDRAKATMNKVATAASDINEAKNTLKFAKENSQKLEENLSSRNKDNTSENRERVDDNTRVSNEEIKNDITEKERQKTERLENNVRDIQRSSEDLLQLRKKQNKEQKRQFKLFNKKEKQNGKNKLSRKIVRGLAMGTAAALSYAATMAFKDSSGVAEMLAVKKGTTETLNKFDSILERRDQEKLGVVTPGLLESKEEVQERYEDFAETMAVDATIQANEVLDLKGYNRDEMSNEEIDDLVKRELLGIKERAETKITVKAKDKNIERSILENEYIIAKENFINEMKDKMGIGDVQANAIINSIHDALEERKELLTLGLTEATREFVLKSKEKMIYDTMKSFELITKDISADKVPIENKEVGRYNDVINKTEGLTSQLQNAGMVKDQSLVDPESEDTINIRKIQENILLLK